MAFVDALSRNPASRGINVHIISHEDWIASVQSQDLVVTQTIEIILSGDRSNHKDTFRNYAVKGGKLYRLTPQGQRLVLPKNCRWQILRKFHDDKGHFAFDKTFEAISIHFWFPKMRRFIQKYIASCIPCTYHKLKAGKQPGYLHPINKIAIPFHTIHIDHLGPFPKSSCGDTYLFLIIDAFTKFILIRPVRATTTCLAINELKEVFSIFGSPSRLICDAASCFTSKKFKDFCNAAGIHQFVNTVGLPRGNGQIERYCATITTSLATSSADSPSDWNSHIGRIQLSLNNTVNKALHATPQELLTGYRAHSGDDIPLDLLPPRNIDVVKLREAAALNMTRQQSKDKKRFDAKRSAPPHYKIGDLVVVKIASIITKGEGRKLLPKWKGPFKITKGLPNDRYEVQQLKNLSHPRKYIGVYAVEHIKPWFACYTSSDED